MNWSGLKFNKRFFYCSLLWKSIREWLYYDPLDSNNANEKGLIWILGGIRRDVILVICRLGWWVIFTAIQILGEAEGWLAIRGFGILFGSLFTNDDRGMDWSVVGRLMPVCVCRGGINCVTFNNCSWCCFSFNESISRHVGGSILVLWCTLDNAQGTKEEVNFGH